jgi:hypothetical protein
MLQQRAIQRDGHVEEFSPEEGWDLLDRQARRYLKMDGEEFIARWDAGEFDAWSRGYASGHTPAARPVGLAFKACPAGSLTKLHTTS